MLEFNKALDRFQPSPIQEIFSLASRLKAQGQDIIDLSLGEPDFHTPEHIKRAGMAAIEDNNTKYTSSEGTQALKIAIQAKLKRDNGLAYSPSQIVVDSGVKPLLFHTMLAVLDPGSEVIVPTPCWTSYPGMVMMAGGDPVFVACPEDKGFKLQAEDLEAAITDKTRLLLLNSPSNPTGAAYNAAEMKSLTDVMMRHPHVWILADDIYEHIVFGGFKHANPVQVEPELFERTITLNGVSKAYAMTGWRIGYAAGPDKLMKALVKILSQATGCASAMSQAAAVAALNGPQDFLKDWADIYKQNPSGLSRSALKRRAGSSVPYPRRGFLFVSLLPGGFGQDHTGRRFAGDKYRFCALLA